MLIAHLIGGAIIFASFLLRTPQASSTFSLFLIALRSVAPVSFLQQIEDAFPSVPAFIDSPSFYSDIVFSPDPAVIDLVVYHPASQHTNPGSAASANVSSEPVIREVCQQERSSSLKGDEKPVSTSATYFNLFLFLAPPCAALTLYLTYVSHLGHSREYNSQKRLQTSFSLPDLDLSFRANTLAHQVTFLLMIPDSISPRNPRMI